MNLPLLPDIHTFFLAAPTGLRSSSHVPGRGECGEVHCARSSEGDQLSHGQAADRRPEDAPAVVSTGDKGAIRAGHSAHHRKAIRSAGPHARLSKNNTVLA